MGCVVISFFDVLPARPPLMACHREIVQCLWDNCSCPGICPERPGGADTLIRVLDRDVSLYAIVQTASASRLAPPPPRARPKPRVRA